MGFFKNLFGAKSDPAARDSAAEDPAQDKNLVRVYDGYGREMFIPKSQWRDEVLLPNIRKAWNEPNDLYTLIVSALKDGFRAEIVDAAKRLFETDSNASRAACLWGIVLMDEGRLDQAEAVFRGFMERHGEDGIILTNLAKVYSRRGDTTRADELLWQALELDPNQENGFGWYVANFRERGGEETALEATRRVAALPRSWRAQLWLARAALQSRELDPALALYAEAISRAGDPAPTDLLMQMSSDLGNFAHLPELVRLTEPRFRPELHGLMVGNNLIKAHLDLGQLDDARRIVDELFAQKRPDWEQTLGVWDSEIAKARLSTIPRTAAESLKFAMLAIDGPVWLKPDSPASELFPPRSTDGAAICFIGSSAEYATNSKRPQAQMSDAAGRLSRALPLFLAEQVEFGARARARSLIPWITEPSGAFAVTNSCWSDEAASNFARQNEPKGDYVVITHLKTQAEPWAVELRLVRAIDGKCLGALDGAFPPASPQMAFPELARRLLKLLADEAGVGLRALPEWYELPPAEQHANYLLRLEQMLVVRCAAMEGAKPGSISGEHEIINGNIQLCAACPKSVSLRILLAQTLVTMKRVRRAVLPAFRDKATLLQEEHPLPEPAFGMVQRLLDEAFGL